MMKHGAIVVSCCAALATAALHECRERLVSDGEAEYLGEGLRLGVISRARHELPCPTLTRADREFPAFWIGGLYWRPLLQDRGRPRRVLGLDPAPRAPRGAPMSHRR